MIVKLKEPERAAPLFGGWEETIPWSCLQGVMGSVYADREEKPRSAAAVLGDFHFFAGLPSAELASFLPERRSYLLLIPQSEGWSRMIEGAYGARCRRITRYALKKEAGGFDRRGLKRAAAALPPGYALEEIGPSLYRACAGMEWSRDLVSQFPAYETYRRLGLGVAAVRGGEPVSGASSYSRYRGGIEVEIDTRPDHRRRGLARACGAALILTCLDRGLYPSWDAHSPESLALAQSLGYRFDRSYTAYEAVPNPE